MSDSPRFDVPALGKTWAVVPPNGRDKKEFCRWLKQQARAELNEARADIGEETYQQQLSLHLSSAAAGLFAWSAPMTQQAMKQPGSPGRLHMLLLLLMRNHAAALVADDAENNPAEAVYEGAATVQVNVPVEMDHNTTGMKIVETLWRNEFDIALDAVLGPAPNSRPPATGAKTTA